MSIPAAAAETFTEDERRVLQPFFSNLDSHVFALTNLPETVKGALFARYSRSAKSLRRLFLDEFADNVAGMRVDASTVGVERAEKLYAKVFNEYGDDSVAQLGGAHVACEYVSNVLTKILEWGRLMAYLEQSTRYVPYTDKLHGRWRYLVPAEVQGALRDRYVKTMDAAFETPSQAMCAPPSCATESSPYSFRTRAYSVSARPVPTAFEGACAPAASICPRNSSRKSRRTDFAERE